MPIILSTNMGMPVPVVGVEAGPQWALDVNACLAILDAHDHTPGYGAPITPQALNISSDLTFMANNATDLRSTRYTPQVLPLALPTDLGTIYVSGVDLYYNDVNGNQIRITQSGGISGTPGSITGLVAPASATYVPLSSTFIFQSAVNTPAYLDGASILLRNFVANSFALTLNPPAAMAANYSLTLPTLPSSQKFMTLDAAGLMSAPWSVDNTTIEISANLVQVKDLGITTAKINDLAVTTAKIDGNSVTSAKLVDLNVTTAKLDNLSVTTGKIADGAVTREKRAPIGNVVSGTIGTFTTTSTSFVSVTNSEALITTTGKAVVVVLTADPAATEGYIGVANGTANTCGGDFELRRDTNTIATFPLKTYFATINANNKLQIPCAAVWTFNGTSAGTYNYNIRIRSDEATTTTTVSGVLLSVYEL